MKSTYADRETVGSIYLGAQGNDNKGILVGDVNSDLVDSLVNDLNTVFASNPYQDRPFFVSVVEERDLMMKNAIKRRIFTQLYVPYPEDNTLVLKVIPKEEKVLFCWDIPHHSEFLNILTNDHLYDAQYVNLIKQWRQNDLSGFGFVKVHVDNSTVDGYDQKVLNTYRDAYLNFLKVKGMDQKDIDNERFFGYFWVPNKNFKYKDVTKRLHHIITD